MAVQRYDSPAFTPHPEDLAAIGRAVEKRQREFAAGRAAARVALGKLGEPAPFIGIGPNRNPLWPEGITGSLTHTSGLALAVVARRENTTALGLDLELSAAVTPDLWPGILTAAEIAQIRALPVELQVERATLIFCAKECFFKLQHPLTGTWVDFHDAEVALVPGTGEFHLTCSLAAVNDRLGRARISGRFTCGHGFTLAAMHLSRARNQP